MLWKKKSFKITRKIYINNEEMNYSKIVSHINQILYFRDTVIGTKSHKNFGRHTDPGTGKGN